MFLYFTVVAFKILLFSFYMNTLLSSYLCNICRYDKGMDIIGPGTDLSVWINLTDVTIRK